MEVASLQHLGDSFSCGWLKRGAPAPSFERLVGADLGNSFGSSRSFIDMDPAELFSMRWTTKTTATESDFEFGLPGGGGSSDPPSPVLVSASQVIRNGRLLPSKPVCRPGALEQHGEHVADLPGAPRSSPSSSLYRWARSTTASLRSCSCWRSGVAGSWNATARPPPLFAAGWRGWALGRRWPALPCQGSPRGGPGAVPPLFVLGWADALLVAAPWPPLWWPPPYCRAAPW